MSTLQDLKIRIVAVIGSEKNGCTGNDLIRIYKDIYGKDLHPNEYGFKDLNSLLVSSTMQGEGGIIYKNGRYFAAGDKNTIKMLDLVRHTRSRNSKARRKFNAVTSVKGGSSSVSTPTHFHSIKAENMKLPERSQMVKEAIAIKQVTTQPQPNSDKVSNIGQQTNPKAKFCARRMGPSHVFENQQSQLISPMRTSDNNQSLPIQRNYNHDDHAVASVSETQRLPQPNMIGKNGRMMFQKGRKRLVKIIEQHGGQMNFSELSNSYLHFFGVPLNSAEICRLFNANEKEIHDLYMFLKSYLYNYVVVTKHADDLLLTVIDDEDDIDEFEKLSIIDTMTQNSVLPTDQPINPITFTSAKTEATAISCPLDLQPSVLAAGDRHEYREGSALASAIRSRDDYLPYKVLADKVLSFVRAKGSFKVSDLPKIFYEEDGRHIDPKNYPEGTWENIIRKSLLVSRHSELTLQDGVLVLRKDFQKSAFPFANSPNNLTNTQNENERSIPLNSNDSNVPAAIIYDLLVEAGRPLHQKELLEKLCARGIEVNVCQLTVRLITKFKDVFCCKFDVAGFLISLARNAKRPEEPTVSSCLPLFTESVKIDTHVMSDYCSTTESAGNIFKPILLVNIVLIDEPPNKFRIQASFRLRSFERAYISFEKKMW
uniref:HTH OST-type domain-containing protein n=1 Tax=Loa loa TaxID=7209 RepID=A0A1I7W5C2_LOALO